MTFWSTVTASPSVTNTRDVRSQIRCRVGEVRRVGDVGSTPVPTLTLIPETLELNSCKEATFSLSLPPGWSEADPLCIEGMRLTGGSDMPIKMKLRVQIPTTKYYLIGMKD